MVLLNVFLPFFIFAFPYFQNPFFVDYCVNYFSPFNYTPKGGSLDLVDSSFVLFYGNQKFYGGFSFSKSPGIFDFSQKHPFTLFLGKITGSDRFLGFALSQAYESQKNFSGVDLISKSEVSFIYPSVFYSKRLAQEDLIVFRAGLPYFRDLLITPSDTFESKTKLALDMALFYFRPYNFQWSYYLFLSYYIRWYQEKYITVQSLLGYDSTKVYSRLGANFYVHYSPFRNTYLALGPVLKVESESFASYVSFVGQYEVVSNLFLYCEYHYGFYSRVNRTGNFESKTFESSWVGPVLGVRLKRDFLFFVLDYSLSENRFHSISFKFDFVR